MKIMRLQFLLFWYKKRNLFWERERERDLQILGQKNAGLQIGLILIVDLKIICLLIGSLQIVCLEIWRLYYLEQKYISKIIIRLLLHQMITKNITLFHVSLCLYLVNNNNCLNHLHMLLNRYFETRWRDLPSHLKTSFFSYLYLTMCDTFSLAAFLPTTWLVSGFGVTMEMTKQPYSITVAAKSQTI